MDTPKNPAPKWAKVALAVVAVVLLQACFGGADTPKEKSAEQALKESVQSEMLPGFLPYEVIEALKKEGMTDEKNHMKDGTSHHLTGGLNGHQLSVDITTWRLGGEAGASGFTAMAIAANNTNMRDAMDFFKYLASAHYEGAEPVNAQAWVEANFDADSAAIDIGEGHFLLRATTPGSRMLTLYRATAP